MKKAVLFLLAGAVVTSALAAYYQASHLSIDGKLVSTSLIERNGVTYVPVRDVATALGKTLTKTASGYDIGGAVSGGAYQINGVTGKVGDVLFNCYARFQVVKVIRSTAYTNQFNSDHDVVKPYPVDQELIIVVCRIKNGTNETVTCGLPGGGNTALTDNDEHSYGPDHRSIDAPSNGVKILPGAAVDFGITFDVPPGTQLKDLVYEPTFYGVLGASAKKFRISVAGN